MSRSITRAFQQLRDLVRAKELVGTDKYGNKYYRWYEHQRGTRKERRLVKASGADYLYDPKTITGEWRMWLHKTRQDPPTEEEIAKSEAKASALKERVRLLEEKQRMMRFQMQSMGNAPSSSSPGVEAFLQSMSQADGKDQQSSSKPPS